MAKMSAVEHSVRYEHLVRAKMHLRVALDSLHEAKRCLFNAQKTQMSFKLKSLLHGVNSLNNDVVRSAAYHDKHGLTGEKTT